MIARRCLRLGPSALLAMALVTDHVAAAESPAKGLQLAQASGGASLQIANRPFYAGETITVGYPYVEVKRGAAHRGNGELYGVRVIVQGCRSSDQVQGYRGKVEIKPRVCGAFTDIGLQLYRHPNPIGPIKKIRVRPYVGMVPNALGVETGKALIDPVTATVTPPSMGEFLNPDTVKKITGWQLTLHELGAPIRGGRHSMDRQAKSWSVKSTGTQKFDVNLNYFSLLPALYELRLSVRVRGHRWGGTFVVARKRFSKRPTPKPGALKLSRPMPAKGTRYYFNYTGPRVPGGMWGLGASQVRKGPGGRLYGPGGVRKPLGQGRERNFLNSWRRPHHLALSYFRGWTVVLDRLLPIEYPPPERPRVVQVRAGTDFTVMQGEAIPAYADTRDILKGVAPNVARNIRLRAGLYRKDDYFGALRSRLTGPGGPMSSPAAAEVQRKIQENTAKMMALFERMRQADNARDIEARNALSKEATKLQNEANQLLQEMRKTMTTPPGPRPGGAPPPQPPPPKPIKTWPLKVGTQTSWVIAEELEPGEYVLAIVGRDRGRTRYYGRSEIVVLQRFDKNPMDLGGRRTFEIAEEIQVTLPALRQTRFHELQLSGAGGFLPGCGYALPPQVRGVRLGTERGYTLHAPSQPGRYLLRLVSIHKETRVLAETPIDVVATPDPAGLITLDKERYAPEETINVRINPKADLYFYKAQGGKRTDRPNLGWGIRSLGYVAAGGAINYGRRVNWQRNPEKLGGGAIRAPAPGIYAVVVQPYGPAPLRNMVSIKTFVVAHPGQSIDQGPDGPPPSPFPDASYPFPPVGEFVPQGKCRHPFLPDEKPEAMTLRFVEREQDAYRPVNGDLRFGQSFFIEGELEEPARRTSYRARIETAAGGDQEVTLFATPDDPKRVRSKMLYFIWEDPKERDDAARN